MENLKWCYYILLFNKSILRISFASATIFPRKRKAHKIRDNLSPKEFPWISNRDGLPL